MDISYGPIFAIATWSTILVSSTYTLLTLTCATAVTIWACRRFIRERKYIHAPEMEPYSSWRREWLMHGRLYFILRSFIQITIFNSAVISIASLPIVIAIYANASYSGLFLTIGIFIALAGFLIETLADRQLDYFASRKDAGTESDPFMMNGIYAYSRHPKKFGESLIWWGFAFAVLPLPYGFYGLISPLLVSLVFSFITGPEIENQRQKLYGDDYDIYAANTNYFLPQFTSSSSVWIDTDETAQRN